MQVGISCQTWKQKKAFGDKQKYERVNGNNLQSYGTWSETNPDSLVNSKLYCSMTEVEKYLNCDFWTICIKLEKKKSCKQEIDSISKATAAFSRMLNGETVEGESEPDTAAVRSELYNRARSNNQYYGQVIYIYKK